MYKEILEEEVDRVLLQYLDEFKNIMNVRQIDIDDYLKKINIEDEANDVYYYNNLIIDDYFKKPIIIEEDDSRPNFDAFYKEFYLAVKDAFLKEISESN